MNEFKHFIDIADGCMHFDKAKLRPANRVIGQRIRIFHKQSKIRCTISFGTTPPSTIVGDILAKNDSCELLLQYANANSFQPFPFLIKKIL